MKAEYNTDDYNAYQKLEVKINADAEQIFYYFGTTSGSKQWFPELTLEDEPRPEKLLFDPGDGTHEHLYILDFIEQRRLLFTWGAGDVQLELLEIGDDQTMVTLNESLPLAVGNVAQDFAGWYFQMENLKLISETGELQELDMEAFKERKKKVEDELGV